MTNEKRLMEYMRKSLSWIGRLIFDEERYRRCRARVISYFRVDKETKYQRIRDEFFQPKRKREEYRNLHRARLVHQVPVEEPMVLISQVARSGGTLLKRLFDNHPQCHVYPVELAMGIKPDIYEYRWPMLDLGNAPDTWLRSLVQIHVWRWLNEDFRYWPTDEETYPFIFFPLLCKRIFLERVSEAAVDTERDIFNHYLTAFFNAWIDNQNLYTGRKRCVVAFAPNMGLERSNIEQFFKVYPDGRHISIVRDPKNWYASASRYRPNTYGDIDASLKRYWSGSTQVALDMKRTRPDQVFLLSFEDLVLRTKVTLEQLVCKIGVNFTDSMLIPTFNGQRIKANSSFKGKREISDAALHRYKDVLSNEEIERIEQQTSQLYEEALQAVEG
jgi:hypothetical protein